MKTKNTISILFFASILLLSAILLNTATAVFTPISIQLQGVWEFDEYYAFNPETNRYERHKEWEGMGGLPYVAFSGEYVCAWGTISVGNWSGANPCEAGFFKFTIKNDLITINRYNKPPLKWRFSLKNKKLEINELSVDPVWGTPEHKLKFIYKKTDMEPPALEPGEAESLQAPTKISNLQILFITSHSATITWATEKPSDSHIEYKVSAKDSASFYSEDLVTEHVLTLEMLDGGKQYTFFVRSCNNDGCISNESEDSSFTTLQRSEKFQKIECQGGMLEVPDDRWLVFLSVSESVIAEFLEFDAEIQAFEITGYEGQTDFSYRVLSKKGEKIKIGPTLTLWAPSPGGKSWLVFIDPNFISDISRKDSHSKHIMWKGEKSPESKVELSCNGIPFTGTGKLPPSYETSKLPWQKRLQGVWQLETELQSKLIGPRETFTTNVTKKSERPYITFKNNKACLDEYPCPREKFFQFTVSKQSPFTIVKTPNAVTLIIKTPEKKLRFGFDLQEDNLIEETFLHLYPNKSKSQVFRHIEEAESTNMINQSQKIPSSTRPSIPLLPMPTGIPPAPPPPATLAPPESSPSPPPFTPPPVSF